MILNLTAFIGSDYVCEFCYKGYNHPRNHHCKYVCNVCFDANCYKYPKRTVHCTDCLRYCNSTYCYDMHKKAPPGKEKPPCDKIKYCNLCNRRYEVTGTTAKHKCPDIGCAHCREDLSGQGKHRCFIQPVSHKEPSTKYIFYDFETRYDGAKHTANFICAITFKGMRFVAEGSDCIARLINHFR